MRFNFQQIIMNKKPVIICLTPVKNEAWILDKFLQATSLWADYIIISDQMSTDGSREIANKYPKVILIENNELTDFNEYKLRKPLFDEARKIEGPRLLISLDADEILTPNFDFQEWQLIKELPAGSIIKIPLVNIYPGFEKYWNSINIPSGYIDDGAEFTTGLIHVSRSFDSNENTIKVFYTNQIKIMHLQYIDWQRMQSKHQWYQCFEKINDPRKSATYIFRQYHHMYAIPKNKIIPIPNEWVQDYYKSGIDITNVQQQEKYWWDEKVLEYIEEYGALYFRKLSIWDVNWEEKAKLWGRKNTDIFKDPRRKFDKLIQNWLIKTQKISRNYIVRIIDRLIKIVFRY